MTRGAPWLALAGALLAAGCGDSAPEPVETPLVPYAPEATVPTPAPFAADFPALSSKDCDEVVRFYFDAVGAGDFARAELAWGEPEVDAVRLAAAFRGYRKPQFEWTDPFVEGAAGSLYCTVAGTVSDAEDPERAVREGTLTLRRANDVPGATPLELRWTIRSSTFVEELAPAGGVEP